ncbi:hypothetical protein FS749_011655 [Ceratobasidium sp. UAMH 11750]|nr:hypothetical protein FS749_011655 [Ceratobasidium sp. UAMH 11750]
MDSGIFKRAGKSIMRSYKLRMPGHLDLPIRVRPWFVGFTFALMLLLSLLGFTSFAHGIMNDKLEHFLGIGTATALFYLMFDVEEDARRIWIWRHFPMISTFLTCFLLGGVISEIVQSLFPNKTFQVGDILANLLGSTVGLYAAYMIERHHRHRREIARLYQPLGQGEPSPSSSEENLSLPLHTQPSKSNTKPGGSTRLANVWDSRSREELFGIGEEDDPSDDERNQRP